MIARIGSPKDFWLGALYLALGLGGILVAMNYAFGTAGRMGPGYFPTVISGLLSLFGLVALVRGLTRPGAPVEAINLKGIVLITASVCAFALLLRPAGLPLALLASLLLAASASVRFRFDWLASALLVLLILFCVLVFVRGLGIPAPLVGSWIRAVLAGS